MITSKKELKEFLRWDAIALGYKQDAKPSLFSDEIWKFQIYLRKYEYYANSKTTCWSKILLYYYKYQYHRWSLKLGFSIPINVFDKGLSIAHYGTIVVNSHAKVGINCRIQENVTIGATGGSSLSPHIGDNVFIGSGARIIGNIVIGNNVAIGANAVVTKNFDSNLTIAGVPAVVISKNETSGFIKPEALKLYNLSYK